MIYKCIALFNLLPTSQLYRWLIAADWLEEKNKEIEASSFREGIFVLEIVNFEINADGNGYGSGSGYGGNSWGNGYGYMGGGGSGFGSGSGRGISDGEGNSCGK
jgi:hypothetical protein